MFVSESNIFGSTTIKIRICSMEGADVIVDISPDVTVDRLKIIAVSNLYDPNESVKLSLYHKLVHVKTGNYLSEEATISHEQIQEGDELLLLRKRIPLMSSLDTSKQKDDTKGPSFEAIQAASQDIPVKNEERPAVSEGSAVDFQVELRKILVSLIEAAQRILCLNPEATKVFKEAEDYMQEQIAPPQVDQQVVQQLLDMGFPKERAVKSLQLNRMSMSDAIQWLVDHEQDEDIDVPLYPSPDEPQGDVESTAVPDSPDEKDTSSSEDEEQGASAVVAPKRVAHILKCFRAFRRRKFKPNPVALKNLVDMGFNEGEAREALRVAGNKEAEACEWLLGGGNQQSVDSDCDEGLDKDSPLYQAIMANPTVQLGLSNPRSLLAFLHMLDSPNNTQQWLNDPDTGPMLIQISRIYHAEKHAPRRSMTSSPSNPSYQFPRPGPSTS